MIFVGVFMGRGVDGAGETTGIADEVIGVEAGGSVVTSLNKINCIIQNYHNRNSLS
jgi:hypothetical protein